MDEKVFCFNCMYFDYMYFNIHKDETNEGDFGDISFCTHSYNIRTEIITTPLERYENIIEKGLCYDINKNNDCKNYEGGD